MDDSIFTILVEGEKLTEVRDIKDHEEAVNLMGLCNGANSLNASICCSTSSVTTTDLGNVSPPCTTYYRRYQ
jgi:hypothetical protein